MGFLQGFLLPWCVLRQKSQRTNNHETTGGGQKHRGFKERQSNQSPLPLPFIKRGPVYDRASKHLRRSGGGVSILWNLHYGGGPNTSDIMAPNLTTSSSSSSRSSLSLSSGLMPSLRGPRPSSPAPRKKWAVALSPSLAGSDHIPAGAPAHPALKWRGSPLAQNPSPMVVGGDGGWGMRK